jgi:serine/threonine-protein kinase
LHQVALQRSKYRILGLVGQGQFGRVFCAVDRKAGHLVALKELDRQRFPTHKFLRELHFLLSLQHSNIVACQALEHTPTGRYLVIDYCEGGTLRDLIQAEHQLSLTQSLKLVLDVLAGLEHAHSRGVIHCDIKPENILLNLETTGWVAQISDFGVARLSQELRRDGQGDIGSPAYMAPERFYGQYSPASDLYAVGVLLFELVVGHRPFSGLPGQLMSAHLSQPIEIPDTVPFLLRSTITTALEKLPARRFASAAEMLRSIQLAAEVEESLAQSDTFPLSEPVITLAVPSLESTQLETLQAPVLGLVVEAQQVYQGSASQVCCQTYASDALTGDPLHQWQVQLTDPVQAIMLRPQGCFVLTRSHQHHSSSYSIYCLPRTQAVPTFPESQSECALDRYQLLSLECTVATAIDPQGRWIAIAKVAVEPDLAGDQVVLQISKLPNLQPVKLPVSCLPTHLIALNSRHGIAIFNQRTNETQKSRTILRVFNRRGDFIGTLSLPVPLHQVTSSTTSPYQFLATEQSDPTSALLIDLKPFRILRIELEIAPAFITATSWGYILADRQGKIVLLDHGSRRIGTFEAPASPTAIAAFEDYGLLIASWSGSQGALHRIDLRQLNLDLFI